MYLDKMQVFKGETKAELPCILIHVKQPHSPAVHVERRNEGNGMLRTHTFRANL